MRGLRSRLVQVVLLLVVAVWPLATLAQKNRGLVIDYKHRIITCVWLDREYNRIIARNAEDPGLQSDPAVTKVRILSWPLFALTGKFLFEESELLPPAPDLGGTVNFSGNIDDVAKAAKRKNCYLLYERYVQDGVSGKRSKLRTAPSTSPVGTAPDKDGS